MTVHYKGKPVIKRWKIWVITIVGGYLGGGPQISSGFDLNVNFTLMGSIEGAILLDLGYLLIVLLISMFFQFRGRSSAKEVD